MVDTSHPLNHIPDWDEIDNGTLLDTTFSVVTFGCQMNKHDSERVVGMMNRFGSRKVDTIEESDIVVFLTCCVREAADVRLMGKVSSIKNIPLRAGAAPLSA